jgi:hypothetical protein
VRTSVFLLACFAALVPNCARAQSGDFDVALQGKQVGTASYNIARHAQGLESTSMVRVSAKGIEYAISKAEQLSAAHQLRRLDLSAVVNGSAVHLTAAPESSALVLTIAANGRTTTNRLAAHPAAVLLPDFDPGALETLLKLAAAHNNRDLWAVIPRQTGSVEQIQLATYADEKGSLDGKPVVVHHLIASYAGTSTDLFTGPANQLLQAELPQQGFALVRKGFVLTPPAKPLAPPPTQGDDSAPATNTGATQSSPVRK